MKASTYLKASEAVLTCAFSPSAVHCICPLNADNQGGFGSLLLERFMVWITLREQKKRKEKRNFMWMSSDSHKFWEHPTFQTCIFQLLLLSDRTGGDTFILKILDELQSSSLSQFYVLHPIEWGFFLLPHTGVIQVTQALLAFSEAEKIHHDRETAEEHRWTHYLLLTQSWGWGRVKKVKKEGQSWIFLAWQNSLKYSASFSHVCGDHWSKPGPAVWHKQEWANLQTKNTCNILLMFNKLNSSSVPPLWLSKIQSFSHISFLVGKRKE